MTRNFMICNLPVLELEVISHMRPCCNSGGYTLASDLVVPGDFKKDSGERDHTEADLYL
jgi:hypothetical protein